MCRMSYENALNFVTTGRAPVTAAFAAQILPHLTKGEIRILLKKMQGRKYPYYLAIPPVLAEDNVLVLSIWPRNYPSKGNAARFELSHTSNEPNKVNYGKRALTFARKHWGDQLVKRTWECTLTLAVQDPSKLTSSNQPWHLFEICMALSADLNALNGKDYAPHSTVINDHIVYITHQPARKKELRGQRGGYSNYNCSRCSSGLGLESCKCGFKFHDNKIRNGWDSALPQKVIAYLTNLGHTFVVDPKLAQAVEQGHWVEQTGKKQLRGARWEREKLETQLAAIKATEAAAQRRTDQGAEMRQQSEGAFKEVVAAQAQSKVQAEEAQRGQTRRRRQERKQATAATPSQATAAKKPKRNKR